MSKVQSNNRKALASAAMSSSRASLPASVISDSRFSHIASDPKFRRLPKKDRKVRVDSRFQSMFNDERFTLKYSVDKRGRPVHRSAKENLKRYYELENSESEKEEEAGNSREKRQSDNQVKSHLKQAKKRKKEREVCWNLDTEEESGSSSARVVSGSGCDEDLNDTQALERLAHQMLSGDTVVTKVVKNGRDVSSPQSAEDSDEESDSDGSALSVSVSDPEDDGSKEVDDESQIRLDLARGEGNLSSSSDDSSSEWEFDEEAVVHDWGELDRTAPVTEESTARLAICHQDWDRVRAVDLLLLLNSFKPVDGLVKSVSIYRSEFGKERITKDEKEGPAELEDSDADSYSEALTPEQEEERQCKRRERLRVYELNKLKYYYAIAEMDSVATADKVYSECNGTEFESCAIKLDLRFVPDSMTFDDVDLKERATKVDTGSYKPRIFTNQALQQSNVKLSWDENDYDREQLVRKAFEEETVETLDVQDYVASSSEEEADDIGASSAKQPSKYAALLSFIGNEDSANDPFKNKSIPRTTESMSENLQDFEDNISDSEDDGRLLICDNLRKSSGFNKESHRYTAVELGVAKANRSSSKHDPSMKLSFRERQRQKRMEVKQRKIDKQKLRESTAHSSVRTEQEQSQAFSDDELPDGVDLDDPYFRDELESQDVCNNMPDNARKMKKGRVTISKHSSSCDDISKCDTEKPSGDEDQLRLLVEDSGGKNESKRHFHMRDLIKEAELARKLNKKGKGRNAKLHANDDMISVGNNKNEDDFKINPADSRFSAIYSSSLFNIDPSDPAYKATFAMESIVKEKLKKSTAGNVAKIGKIYKEDTLFSGDTRLPSGGNAGSVNSPSNLFSKGEVWIGGDVPGPTQSGDTEDVNTKRLIQAVKLKTKRLLSKKKVQPDRVVPSN